MGVVPIAFQMAFDNMTFLHLFFAPPPDTTMSRLIAISMVKNLAYRDPIIFTMLEYRYWVWAAVIFTTISASALGIVDPIDLYHLWHTISLVFFSEIIGLELATCAISALNPDPAEEVNLVIKYCLMTYQSIIFGIDL
jgi:hypothetical protein